MKSKTMEYPIHLGEEGTEQFTVTTRVNGEQIGHQKIHDPFIHCTVRLRGFRHFWNALTRGIKVEVSVDASPAASRHIMCMNPYELQAESEVMIAQREATRRGDYSGCENYSAQA